ncbi:MAG: glycosyltransferase family 2 protein [Pseudonocardiaceae bacterium]
MTIAICSNRPVLLFEAIARTLRIVDHGDRVMAVMDTDTTSMGWAFVHPALRIVYNGRNRGLAYSRNRVLEECETRHVIFVDDDIVLTTAVVDGLRGVLGRGADVAGVRITADFQGRQIPWLLTIGQLHYLGVHNPAGPASIWGGCIAVDIARARLLGVDFDERLGRVGSKLSSAEDTTFVRQMLLRGAAQVVLDEPQVTHRIPPERLKFRYLIRRAYWQGRSEVRRGDARQGLLKEWGRNRQAGGARCHGTALAIIYVGAVMIGLAHESLIVAAVRRVSDPLVRPCA